MVERRKNLRGTDIEAEVLLRSRRRCALCFGLDENTNTRRGQIAHLNKDRNDNRFENLAFLCFDHHDEFDGQTSQSKNITRKEIIRYRTDLYQQAESGKLSNPDDVTNLLSNIPTGVFARKSGLDGGANVSIFQTRRNWDGRPVYQILGQSFEGVKREAGPNMGFFSFETVESLLEPISFHDGDYHATLEFADGFLSIEEENSCGHFGMGVYFEGEYSEIKSPFRRLRWWLLSILVSRIRKGQWPNP